MNSRTINVGLFIFAVVGLGIGIALKSSIELGFCLESEPTCINNMTWVGNELFYGMGALALVFLILLLVPRAWEAWKKFAMWFVSLAALLFIFYPEPGSGDYFSPYPETVFKWVSGAYVVISLGIIWFAVLKKKAE